MISMALDISIILLGFGIICSLAFITTHSSKKVSLRGEWY